MVSTEFKGVGLHYTAFRDAIREDSRQTTPSRGVTPRKKFAVEANVESRASESNRFIVARIFSEPHQSPARLVPSVHYLTPSYLVLARPPEAAETLSPVSARAGDLRNLFSPKGPSLFHRGVPARLADALSHITPDGLNTAYYIILLIPPQGGFGIFL